MKSKATGCGSISTVFSGIVLLCVSSIIIIVIHILANISRSKGNPTMKFGHLKECKTRNIFLEKSYAKYGRETSPRPFF